jgi:hypothetical protein
VENLWIGSKLPEATAARNLERAPGHAVPKSNPWPRPAVRAPVKEVQMTSRYAMKASLRMKKGFQVFILLREGTTWAWYEEDS